MESAQQQTTEQQQEKLRELKKDIRRIGYPPKPGQLVVDPVI